jgi:hypothetical protein
VSWETSFVAMSVLVGVDAAEALAALGTSTERDPEARKLAAAMASTSKLQRAQALAAGLGPLTRDVVDADLTEAP